MAAPDSENAKKRANSFPSVKSAVTIILSSFCHIAIGCHIATLKPKIWLKRDLNTAALLGL